MEATAKLILAVSSLVGAIAWPLTLTILIILFRKEFRSAANKLPSLIDRVRKMKLAGIEAELVTVADASEGVDAGEITPRQIEVAAKIEVEASEYELDLLNKLDRLCLEYDAVRRSSPPSPVRTQAMTRILVKMRALAPSLVSHIETYKGSGSAGSRLAAIAMMQMNVQAADIDWLADRFNKEQPFIFYHAALALQSLGADGLSNVEWDHLLGAAERSIDVVKSFRGQPDQQTIDVLESLISSIR